MLSRQKDHHHHYQLPISLPQLVLLTVSFPLIGFVFCIVWSFVYNFESSTATHCEVDNFAPSISAATGSYVPQRYVWQACVAIHSAPRLVLVAVYKGIYERRLSSLSSRWTRLLVRVNVSFALAENLALLGLTVVSSLELFAVHAACFGTFAFSAVGYMFTSNLLFGRRCGFVAKNASERTSVALKKVLLRLNLLFLCLLVAFYYWHNEHCQPYVYSWFCVSEYVVVLSNMAFHSLAYYDFHGLSVAFPATAAALSSAAGYQPLPMEEVDA